MRSLEPGSRLIIDLLGVLTLLTFRGWPTLVTVGFGLLFLSLIQKRLLRIWQGLLSASPFLLAAILLGFFQGPGGIGWAIFLTGKLVVIVIWTRWLLTDFREKDLTQGMHQLRIPHLFAATIFFIFRYQTILQVEMAELRRARALRGGDIKRRGFHLGEYRILGETIGAGLLRSLDRGDRVYQAMRLRGLTAFSLVTTRVTLQKDLWMLLGAIVLAIGAISLDWMIE